MLSIALAFGIGKLILPPDVATAVEQNKTAIVMAGFFCNMVGNALLQSGAFEVYVDNVLVFSKLQSGGVPHHEELYTMVKQLLTTR